VTGPEVIAEAIATQLARHDIVVVGAELVEGGTIARTRRVRLADGRRGFLKTRRSAPAAMWQTEADGLDALRVPGGPRIPEVYAVGDGFLLIEELPQPVPDTDEFWRTFAHRLATVHAVTSDRFGWEHDNLLGMVTQRNPWHDDGHRFYAECRLLRYLDEPLVDATLEPADRHALERVADRLEELVPPMSAALTHGDLWRANVLAAGPLEPALCDPAVSFTWAERDLAMLWCSGGVPDAFFTSYHELHHPASGWEQRYRLLHLPEVLSVIAHAGNLIGSLGELRATLALVR
jgi:fructosamine-3-kinase